MKTTSILFLVFAGLITPLQTLAQQRMMLDANTSMVINEFGAIIILQDEEVVVMRQLKQGDPKPGEDRLEQGDVILMMNGTRVSDIPTLRKVYDELANDEEIKIGVRRGEQRFILSAVKGNFEGIQSGGQRLVIGGNPGGQQDGDGEVRMNFSGDGPPPVLVPELGAILNNRESNIVISNQIPPLVPAELKEEVLTGFVVKEVNGQKPENAEAVKALLEELEVGAEITLTVVKDGEEKMFKFNKAEPQPGLSISIDNE